MYSIPGFRLTAASGTHVRTTAIDILVEKFLSTDPTQTKQIVSLGAGTDTRYFRLLSKHPNLPLIYHELDFPAITLQKISTIQHTPSLHALICSRLSSPATLTISPPRRMPK